MVPLPDPVEISFVTTDKITVYGDYYNPPRPSPLLILLHMYGLNRGSWKQALPEWYGRGFAVLALDMRGHGKSTMQNGTVLRYTFPKTPEENMFIQAWHDIEGACEFLKKYRNCKTNKTILIGASIGCSVALYAGTKLKQVKGAVLLSPGTNYLMVNSMEHIKSFAPLPLLMISDEKESSACKMLIEAGGYKDSVHVIFPGAGHGTDMFNSPQGDRIIHRVADWLDQMFR